MLASYGSAKVATSTVPVHLVAQLLVPPGVGVVRWRRDLHQLQLRRPRWVRLEKLLEREQLVRDALDVVHPVDAEEQLLAWRVKRSETADVRASWRGSHGFSVGSETLGLFSRVRRAAPSLPMQPHEPVVA